MSEKSVMFDRTGYPLPVYPENAPRKPTFTEPGWYGLSGNAKQRRKERRSRKLLRRGAQ